MIERKLHVSFDTKFNIVNWKNVIKSWDSLIIGCCVRVLKPSLVIIPKYINYPFILPWSINCFMNYLLSCPHKVQKDIKKSTKRITVMYMSNLDPNLIICLIFIWTDMSRKNNSLFVRANDELSNVKLIQLSWAGICKRAYVTTFY